MHYPKLIAAVALLAPHIAIAQTDLEPLLAADRAHAAAAHDTDLVTGLAAMFDKDAVLISGGSPTLIRGADAIRARLAENPANAATRVEWSPVGGGISADGTQGYTYGGLTVRPKDGAALQQKYLAYWVKRPEGWRVFAYKRAGRRETGALNVAPPVIGAGPRRAGAEVSLAAAEKAFSDDAQRIGLRAAFQRWGRAESVNIGAADAIAVGGAAIGVGVAGPERGSPVTWAADEALVAPSGDMGVTYGLLHAKAPPGGQPGTVPFFTVWARPKPGDFWRYVAE